MMEPNFDALRTRAERIAAHDRADLDAVIKELLHYEILQAMVSSKTRC
jgi:hypothetical protein